MARRGEANPFSTLSVTNRSTDFGASLNGQLLPAVNTKGFVSGKQRVKAVIKEMDKDIRGITKALPTLDKDGIGYKTLSSRLATLKGERAGLSQQVKNGGYLNSKAGNLQANPNENYYVPKEYAERANVNTTRSF